MDSLIAYLFCNQPFVFQSIHHPFPLYISYHQDNVLALQVKTIHGKILTIQELNNLFITDPDGYWLEIVPAGK